MFRELSPAKGVTRFPQLIFQTSLPGNVSGNLQNMETQRKNSIKYVKNHQISGLSSRISPGRRRRTRLRKRLVFVGVTAVIAVASSVIVASEQQISQAAGPSTVWKNYGNSAIQLNARKSTDGSKVAVCATDRQLNSPRNQWVSYQGSRLISGGQEYRSNAQTFEMKPKEKGETVVFSAGQQYRVAYLVGKLRSAIDKGDPELAATVYAIHSLSGRLTSKQIPSDTVKQRAQQLLTEASSYAGPYRISTPEIKLATGSTQGILRLPVLQSAAGQPLTGINETVTLSGPAHFPGKNPADSFKLSSSESVQEIPLEVTAPGKVGVQVKAGGLPPVSYEVWEHPTWQDLLIAGAPAQVGVSAAADAEPRQFFSVKTETQSQMLPQEQGATLSDEITVKAEGEWGKKTGEESWQTVMVDLAVYGPFSSARGPGEIPPEEKAVQTWQIPATPKSAEEAKAGVSISNQSEPYKAEKPGFYTFVAAVQRSSQPEGTYLKSDYVPAFFEEAETQVVPFSPKVKTQAKVVLSEDDKVLTDQVELSGFPEDHPDFTGIGKWQTDEKIVRNDLYCLPEPIKDQDAKGKKPLASIEVPAKNGTFTVDKDIDGKPLSLKRLPCKDTYVFVSSYKGDARTQPFRSSETETSEQYSLPPVTVPPVVQTVLSKTGGNSSQTLGLGLVALGGGGLLLSYRARRR